MKWKYAGILSQKKGERGWGPYPNSSIHSTHQDSKYPSRLCKNKTKQEPLLQQHPQPCSNLLFHPHHCTHCLWIPHGQASVIYQVLRATGTKLSHTFCLSSRCSYTGYQVVEDDEQPDESSNDVAHESTIVTPRVDHVRQSVHCPCQ